MGRVVLLDVEVIAGGQLEIVDAVVFDLGAEVELVLRRIRALA